MSASRAGRLTRLQDFAQRLPRHLTRRTSWLLRAAFFFVSYAFWVEAFRLLVLTFATYFAVSSRSGTGILPKFEDINESLGPAELTLLAIAALLYAAILRAFHPVTSTTRSEIFTPERIEKRFLPGFFHGALLASVVVLAFVLSGIYKYLGLFIQFEESPFALFNVLLRLLAFGVLVYFEEFLFRHKIVRHLRRWLEPAFDLADRPRGPRLVETASAFGDLGAPLPGPGETPMPALVEEIAPAVITALAYCAVKSLQFDLGVMQWVTLFLVSLSLSVRNLGDGGDFSRGAGFWAAILIVFQPLLSLPVFGHEFTGLLLVKYQGAGPGVPAELADSATSATLRLITGGAGGPLSGLAFQFLIVLDIARGVARYKKTLETTSASPLK